MQFAFGAPQTPLQQTASGAQQMLPQHVPALSQRTEPAQQVENGAPTIPLQHVALTGTGKTPQYFLSGPSGRRYRPPNCEGVGAGITMGLVLTSAGKRSIK